MPIYEYECKNCGNCFEAIIMGSDYMNAVRCPRCEGERVDRVLSTFAKSCFSGRETSGSACTTPKKGGFG